MSDEYVFGVDLDGVCADFYGKMREIVAFWRGVPVEELSPEPVYGLGNWGVPDRQEYDRIHRYAVSERDLFRDLEPLPGCVQSLRRLSTEGVRIRIITHRLFIYHFHKAAVIQTAQWLDKHAIPYWDLCFMRKKGHINAHIYVDDAEANIRELEETGKPVIAFTNSTNVHMDPAPVLRAANWAEVEATVRERYQEWQASREHPIPPAPGSPDTAPPAAA